MNNAFNVTQEDLKKAADQFCPKCKTKYQKYLGLIMGTKAVMWRPMCTCQSGYKSSQKTEKQLFNELQTPFWKMIGAKPKPQEAQLDSYLKRRGIGYGEWRLEREANSAKQQGGVDRFNEHVKKYGRDNAPTPTDFEKRSS